jgi:aminopeptidase N
MTKSILCLLLVFVCGSAAYADTYPKNQKIDIIHYVFRIQLSDQSDAIQCEASVTVRFLSKGTDVLRLDLTKATPALAGKGMTVTQVTAAGKPLSYTHENDELKISLPAASEVNQQQSYTITYSGSPATGLKIANNKYGDRTFFSDNWPDKARNWLSVIDHPYDKATCEFTITAPAHYQVVSNGLLMEETDAANGMRTTHWKQSVPIASWLYVLGVARFAVQQVDQFDHKDIQTWVYYQDRKAGFNDFAEPTRKVLEFYSSYVGPFAYEKLANIQSNSVSGGMEAASAILYSENAVVGDKNERWRNVVIHEIAHQWFGNAVTESDWDDVWLSEGFATYFTLLFIEHEYGHDAFRDGLISSKKTVSAFQAKNPGYTIVHNNLSDMSKVTSSHTYQKGSWILHMLRGVVGEEAFWKGIQAYYQRYQNQNATTADFRIAMEEASGRDLKVFFDQWLYKPGALTVKGSWHYDSKKKELTLSLDQTQTDGSLYAMPIQVAIEAPNKTRQMQTIELTGRQQTITFKSEYEPTAVQIDPNMWVLMDATLERR